MRRFSLSFFVVALVGCAAKTLSTDKGDPSLLRVRDTASPSMDSAGMKDTSIAGENVTTIILPPPAALWPVVAAALLVLCLLTALIFLFISRRRLSEYLSTMIDAVEDCPDCKRAVAARTVEHTRFHRRVKKETSRRFARPSRCRTQGASQ